MGVLHGWRTYSLLDREGSVNIIMCWQCDEQEEMWAEEEERERMSSILDEIENIKPTDNTTTKRVRFADWVDPSNGGHSYNGIPYDDGILDDNYNQVLNGEDWVQRTYDYVDTNIDMPRMFALNRDEDVHGVSGTGTVAYGVQFSDGTVAMHWVGNVSSTSVWTSMAALVTVHGHDGKSRIEWL